ncbi:ABC transporter ATP-binding protein [Candidatus Arthromitus sp. SFB-rat-Yit]|uniref:ABC transporter ATP-binding protein n=1 Tax=Candidatus Arthromitus sp. SFB-rat-Yit TaxID=1041504 RepID=UPI000227A397|nr:ATP-binding cassette domain-containing protein [Candidatus Arthromitus sp. SFB-rat-Yit]BAK81492.1 ATP-binding transport protein NatA [Candidatus Arthromitus sp. SFB-rat-Yit]
MSLKVIDLNKSYFDKKVVDKVNFEVEAGKVYGILGRNGAGKTTTIKIILDIISKDSGRVLFKNNDLDVIREKIGYLPEEKSLYYKSTVWNNLFYFSRISGLDVKESKSKINYWLERFQLEEYVKKPIETLSKGNQQKVQIISTIIHDPDILIFDEPFSGLDPVNSEILRNIVTELVNRGKYIIFCTHQTHYIEEFCDRISIFKNGAQAIEGNLMNIKKSYGRNKLVLEIDGNLPNLNIYGVKGITKNRNVYEINILNENITSDILNILYSNRVKIFNFGLKYKSLHEIFLDTAGDL